MFAANHRRLMQKFPDVSPWLCYLSHAIDVGIAATTLMAAAILSEAVCRIMGL